MDSVLIDTNRWDLRREVDILRETHLSLIERAVQIDVRDGVAEIRLLVDEGNQTVLDLDVDFGALLHLLLEVAACLNTESLSPKVMH